MLNRALDFACFHLWIRIPVRWHCTRPALALLPRAGNYAFGGAVPEPAEGREAVRGSTLRFGLGAWIVNTGTYDGEPCVFIDDAPTWGKVGERAPDVPQGVKPFIRLLFPTAEQATAVQLALTTPPAGDAARVTEADRELRKRAGQMILRLRQFALIQRRRRYPKNAELAAECAELLAALAAREGGA